MERRRWKLATVLLVVIASCRPHSEDASDTYVVRRVGDAAIEVDGALGDAAWNEAVRERGFSFPWQERDAPPTEFRAVTDDAFFYFVFDVHDPDIVVDHGEDETAVARGDRVELFFTPEPDLGSYFCLEIDPSGRVLDYRASYYRELDFDWHLPGMTVASALTETGYRVEGRIPRAALPIKDGVVRTGIFRAEFSHRDGDQARQEWISWVRPSSNEPDFHIPSAFGRLEIR